MSYCSCCGVAKVVYQVKGHDLECIWYEDEMYRLAKEWIGGKDDENRQFRYDLIVGFLLEQVECLKKCLDEERKVREQHYINERLPEQQQQLRCDPRLEEQAKDAETRI